METFSRVLADLYDLAEHTPLQRFPVEMLGVLRKLIEFDGAWLGIGRDAPTGRDSGTTVAIARYASPIILDGSYIPACRDLRGNVVAEFVGPMCAGCLKDDDTCGDPVARENNTTKLMLCEGVAPDNTPQGAWLLLCRADRKEFGSGERQYIHAAWPHLLRGLAINRQRILEQQRKQLEDRAIALVNALGNINAADTCFADFLAAEWPGFTGQRLPQEALECWSRGRPYIGARIEINFRQTAEGLFCIAKVRSSLAGLTKTERIVAQYFASGLSHKEVAQLLAVSQNTVRTHLKQAYSKLGIHDKAQLANRIGATVSHMAGGG